MSDFDFREAKKAIYKSSLSTCARMVLLVLLDHLPDIRPGIERIAEHSGMSTRQAIREVQKLEAIGILVVARATGRSNQYSLADNWIQMIPVTQSHRCQPVTTDPQSPVTGSHHTRDSVSPEALKEEHKQELKEEPNARTCPTGTVESFSLLYAAKAEADSAIHKRVVEHYFAAYEAKRGDKPLFRAPDGKAVKNLLDAVHGDVDTACRIIDNAFADNFWAQKVTIRKIASDPSQFLTRDRRNGTRRSGPPQPGTNAHIQYGDDEIYPTKKTGTDDEKGIR